MTPPDAEDLAPLEGLLAITRPGPVVVLTGAGISAPSGVPTFRGPEGYWTVGSRVYHPQELATAAAFGAMPWEVWRWYLHRAQVCAQAQPNAAHRALVRLEQALGPRFHLITQNVDGLHTRAGSGPERLYAIHGDLGWVRCSRRCTLERWPLDPALRAREPAAPLDAAERQALGCPRCGAPARPHVLWFDEYYEEALFRSDSALQAARQADLLLVIGSTGSTTLPVHALGLAARRRATLIDLNPQDNDLGDFIQRQPHGLALRGDAGAWVPAVVDRLLARAQDARRPS